MKKTNWVKWAKLWLLVVVLTMPPMGMAEPPDITVDVVSKGAFVIFFLKNYEDSDFKCASIRVEATVKDEDERVALRTIMARNISLPAGSLEIKVEAGKDIIGALRNEMNQPRIMALRKLTYRCEPKVFRDRLKDGSSGPEMVRIPAGRFRMGDIQGGGDSNEKPVHWVSVDKFAMGRYEVTFAEYDKFAEATGREKPNDRGRGRGNRPVIYVDWYDAVAYTEWLSQQTGQQYRLPTEAEWEYAARAGTETKYWWGNDIGKNRANCYNNYCGDNFKYTSPVGSYKPNSFGLYDTAGNVGEWTCSEYEGKYKGKEKRCLCNNHAKNSVLSVRGGAWHNSAGRVRSADRFGDGPTNRFDNLGFRVARL
ncbi:formylglycine-generating enzyme family protein [Candidatus Parabeggiatoa sp. HSG14]|uniref:formylglycine-generating enzyme family protein n=1 Tax=Candidatus Parabeggiatoa sp. HSG14 TaxID=3055593 RepID=UPI0025A7CDC1|nr:formylglycine-generating enzyme family protein [Thiotrichales bacterium HSG14]